MEKNLKYGALLAIYGALLTDKQRETIEYYCDEDLSLGEIAENMGISRQGVRDFILRGEEALDDFELKLGLMKKAERVSEIAKAAAAIKEESGEEKTRRLADRILKLTEEL